MLTRIPCKTEDKDEQAEAEAATPLELVVIQKWNKSGKLFSDRALYKIVIQPVAKSPNGSNSPNHSR